MLSEHKDSRYDQLVKLLWYPKGRQTIIDALTDQKVSDKEYLLLRAAREKEVEVRRAFMRKNVIVGGFA